MRISAHERFLRHTRREGDCLLWTGTKDRDGYGVGFYLRGKYVKAHRFAYEDAKGPIPEGLTIDHLCNNRSCVNPDHLDAVTFGENRRRAAQRQTHCKRGHELPPGGSVPRPCQPCNTIRARGYRAQKNGRSS